jgi:hypothetical protein
VRPVVFVLLEFPFSKVVVSFLLKWCPVLFLNKKKDILALVLFSCPSLYYTPASFPFGALPGDISTYWLHLTFLVPMIPPSPSISTVREMRAAREMKDRSIRGFCPIGKLELMVQAKWTLNQPLSRRENGSELAGRCSTETAGLPHRQPYVYPRCCQAPIREEPLVTIPRLGTRIYGSTLFLPVHIFASRARKTTQ